jgi:hypothetical protein
MNNDIIARLRDLVPLRPLTHIESLVVAERQATRFLQLSGVTEPPVPDSVITSLPRIHVEPVALGGTQGGAQWSNGRWIVVINSLDSSGRQRFSLFHEFKHIVDHPFRNLLYPDSRSGDGEEWIETLCERFAADVLMPRAWVKRAWARDRIQTTRALARLFGVSLQAMRIRLEQLDFIEPVRARCSYSPTHRPNKEDARDYLTSTARTA